MRTKSVGEDAGWIWERTRTHEEKHEAARYSVTRNRYKETI